MNNLHLSKLRNKTPIRNTKTLFIRYRETTWIAYFYLRNVIERKKIRSTTNNFISYQEATWIHLSTLHSTKQNL
jgi:hypothetical protein